MLKLNIGLIGFCLLSSCQYHDASVDSTSKIPKHTEAASYNTQLGLAYLKQGDTARAKRKLLLALDFAPKSSETNAAMAYFLEKTGDINTAKTYYQKALALDPKSGAQLNNYGAFLCRTGNYKAADSYFLQAVNDVNYIHTAGAYENAGLCAIAAKNDAKAKDYFKQALKHDADKRQSLFELAKIKLREHHPHHALQDLQQYQVLASDDVLLLTLGLEAARQAGQIDMEASYLTRLSQLHNNTDNAGVKNDYNSSNG